jgi:hypothetical protein
MGVKAQEGQVRDLWARKDLGVQKKVHVFLKPHSSVLYSVTAP